ncbi:MAG: hypothetical protein M3076_17055 [Actinomycetota bacterium]|nr:hypothetical protein [Actinomycetota bacterium]
MLRRLRRHASYANVASTLALFIALGGVSYAAIRLPAGSVGTAQIRSHAVTLREIATGAQRALRGKTGPRGPQGTAGTPGTPGTARAYGEVSGSGALSNSFGNPSVSHPTTGRYCVTVPGVDPATSTIAVTLNVGSASSAAPTSEAAGAGAVCPVGTWEVATGTLQSVAAGNLVNFIDADEPFGFVAP